MLRRHRMAIWYRAQGRSYWAARYRDRHEDLYEWDVDWVDLPRAGLVEVRLHCPNGQVGVLGNTVDLSDRAFQFKEAAVLVPGGRQTLRQTIGILLSPEGEALTYSWDYQRRALVGPVQEKVTHTAYLPSAGPVGKLHFELLGARLD